MPAVPSGDDEDADQQQHGGRYRGKDYARRVVAPVVDLHKNEQRQQAEKRPDRLLQHVWVRRAILLFGHDRRGGEDRHQPEEHKQQHRTEEPLVDANALCHTACFPAPTKKLVILAAGGGAVFLSADHPNLSG